MLRLNNICLKSVLSGVIAIVTRAVQAYIGSTDVTHLHLHTASAYLVMVALRPKRVVSKCIVTL
jgi:hypothetical protein